MNRKEFIDTLSYMKNVYDVEDWGVQHNHIKTLFELLISTDRINYIKNYSKILSFLNEFSGIRFNRKEKISDDTITISIEVGSLIYHKEFGISVFYIGQVKNSCGIIEQFYMDEHGRFGKAKGEHWCYDPNGWLTYDTADFLHYLLTEEYDYHIAVTDETYQKLRSAGWYENRKVDISRIVAITKENSIVLTEKQLLFLSEFAGLKDSSDHSNRSFFVADNDCYNNYRGFFNKSYFIYEDCKFTDIYIGRCMGEICSLDLSPDGLLLCDDAPKGRTVMEGWKLILKH